VTKEELSITVRFMHTSDKEAQLSKQFFSAEAILIAFRMLTVLTALNMF
jgi:hypothetical protein